MRKIGRITSSVELKNLAGVFSPKFSFKIESTEFPSDLSLISCRRRVEVRRPISSRKRRIIGILA